MENFYYLFVSLHPFFPMPKVSVIPLHAVCGGVFLIWLSLSTIKPRPRSIYPLHFSFFFLFAWIVLADLVNLARIQTWEEFRHVGGRTLLLVSILATYYVVRDRQQYKRVIGFLITGVLALALFTIFCAIFHVNPLGAHTSRLPRTFWDVTMPFPRTIGVPMSYGTYGLILNSAIPIFLVSAWRKDFLLPRFWALAGLLILLFALFITQSRNSWIATLLVFFFLTSVLVLASRDFHLKTASITAFFLITVIAIGWFSDVLQTNVKGFTSGLNAHSFYGRLEMDRWAVDLFLSDWFLGVGHEAARKPVQEIGQEPDQAGVIHNTYLDQLATTGIFGFIPFLAVILLTFLTLLRIAWQGLHYWRPYAVCLAGSFLANMSLFLGYKGFFSETLAIEYGLMLSLVELSRMDEKDGAFDGERSSSVPPDYHLV